MKKIIFPFFLAGFSLFFYSCGTTSSAVSSSKPVETVEEISAGDEKSAEKTDEAVVPDTSLTGAETAGTEDISGADSGLDSSENAASSGISNQTASESGTTAEPPEEEDFELIGEDELLSQVEAEEPVVLSENLEEPSFIDTPEEANSSVRAGDAPSENGGITSYGTSPSAPLLSTASGASVSEAAVLPSSSERTAASQPSSAQASASRTPAGQELSASEKSNRQDLSSSNPAAANGLSSQNSAPSNSYTDSSRNSPSVASSSTLNDEKQGADSDTKNEDTDSAEEIIPSRSVTVNKNQYLDIVYPGSGWVYLGESRDPKLLTYFGRKLGSGDTTFTLRSKTAGETLLHFYKNDALTGSYIDDYLAVTVTPEAAKTNEHVKAPSYAEVVPPKPSRIRGPEENAPKTTQTVKKITTAPAQPASKETPREETSAAKTQAVLPPVSDSDGSKTVIQTTGSQEKQTDALSTNVTSGTSAQLPSVVKEENTVDSNLSLLDQARQDYEAKRFTAALSKVQSYIQQSSVRIDEALYLQGQILEAESDVRDIRSAIDSYDYLTKNYPSSSWWVQANKRSIYLKRFYIDIR